MPKTFNDEFDLHITQRRHQAPPGARRVKKSADEIADELRNDSARMSQDLPQEFYDGEIAPDTETIAGEESRREDVRERRTPKAKATADTRRRSPRPKDDDFDDAPPSRRAPLQTEPPAIIRFFTDRRLHVFFGVACLLVGCVMAVILVSHLRNGGVDQSRAANLNVEQIATDAQPVENSGGAIGAKLSQILFAESLGLGSLVIALYLIILGITIVRHKPLNFWSKTFKALLLTIALSVVPGLVCYSAGTEISWGGIHGHAVNETLMRLGGPVIAVAVSCVILAAIGSVYLNDIIYAWRVWRQKQRAISDALPSFRSHSHAAALDDKSIVEPDDVPLEPEPEYENEPELELEPEPQSEPDPEPEADTLSFDTPEPVEEPAPATAFSIDSPAVQEVTTTPDLGFSVDVPEADTIDDGRAVTETKPYDHRASLSRYKFPTLDILDEAPGRTTVDEEEQQQNKKRIIKALADHKVTISSIKATVGPTVTLFEVVPTEGTRIAQIKRLEDDIAMTLKARGIRIIAPMPGKGTVGIEVPNSDPQTVSMRSVLASTKFRECKKALPVALGATVSNDIFVADLASMPHVLVAGATGQGKSVGLNCIIASLLYKKHPTELKFILIDPKEVEFSLYSRLCNHYLAAVPGVDEETGIITKHENVLMALNSLCVLMDQRYSLLRKAGVRNIVEYNRKFTAHELNPENGHDFMPYIVVIIDEFADLIMTAGKEIELPVTRITQKARAVGIHMVIATQRPSTNVLTGLIKANCPTRIAFRVMQMVDSRTILDRPGANQLIGRGDMLYSQGGEVERMQCAFIDTDEVDRLCRFVGEQIGFEKPYMLPEPKFTDENSMTGTSHATAPGAERDPLFDEAARFIITQSTASVSSLQRRYQIGYNRAGKIMDQMEASGIVGPAVGAKPRNILVDGPTLDLILENKPY